jgi:hypothetical protein
MNWYVAVRKQEQGEDLACRKIQDLVTLVKGFFSGLSEIYIYEKKNC